MPSKSGKQHRFMEMIAHDPKKAKEKGISPSVGKDFVEADKSQGKHFSRHSDGQFNYNAKPCTHMNAHAYGKCPS